MKILIDLKVSRIKILKFVHLEAFKIEINFLFAIECMKFELCNEL